MHAEEAAIESERRARIRGLGISALFGMQVMLLSIALYASDWYGGMEAGFEQLFRWLAMMLTVPVLVWPGRAFFTGAAAALRNRRLTMDVPVALGLSIAFAGSAFATVTGEGEVWFDSVVMFVTLLSAARYLELLARRRATAAIRALARSAPLVATRVREGRTDRAETPTAGPRATLRAGDRRPEPRPPATEEKAYRHSSVQPGQRRLRLRRATRQRRRGGTERIPAAALRPATGCGYAPARWCPPTARSAPDTPRSTSRCSPESRIRSRVRPASRVLAGSINGSGVVEVEVTSAGDATVLGGVLHRAEQAARERPAIAQLADRAAAWFIGGVLVLAAGVAIGWLLHDPARMIPVLVSVLVVTCPCALSLATPAAMTAALGALARAGLIATRANAVERLALATRCLADKTGTLTEGRFRLQSVSTFSGFSKSRCLALAAALEHYATHPDGVRAHRGRGRRRRRRACHRGYVDAAGDEETCRRGCGCSRNSRPESCNRAHESPASPSPRTLTAPPRRSKSPSRIPAAPMDGSTASGTRWAARNSSLVICGLDMAACGASGTGEDTSASSPRSRTPETAAPAGSGVSGPSVPRGNKTDNRAPARPTTAPVASSSHTRGRPARPLKSSRTPCAPTHSALVEDVHRRGIETTIASGDSPVRGGTRSPRSRNRRTHLAELSPEDKLAEAAHLAASGERVLMLGDGVNDAPALIGAHVSVAMGRGAADRRGPRRRGAHCAVLIDDDLDRASPARSTSRADDRHIVKQNQRRAPWATTTSRCRSPPPVQCRAGPRPSACPSARSRWPRTRTASAAGRTRPEADHDGDPSAPHRNLHRRGHRDCGDIRVGGPLGPVRRPRHPGSQNPRGRRRVTSRRQNQISGLLFEVVVDSFPEGTFNPVLRVHLERNYIARAQHPPALNPVVLDEA